MTRDQDRRKFSSISAEERKRICMCRFIGESVQKDDDLVDYAGIGHSGGVVCTAFLFYSANRQN